MKLSITIILFLLHSSYSISATREHDENPESWSNVEKLLDSSDAQTKRTRNFNTQADQLHNLIPRARECFEKEATDEQSETDIKKWLEGKLRFLYVQETLGLQTRERCYAAIRSGQLTPPEVIDAAQHWRDILTIVHTNLQEIITAQVCHQLLEMSVCAQEIEDVEKYIKKLKQRLPLEQKQSKDSQ